MNLFNKALLKVVLLPAPVYEKMGVNVSHLKAILTTKLIMDDRRPNSFQQMRQKARKKPITNATLSTLFMSILAGCLFIYVCFYLANSITQFTIYFSFYITFLASILIADFTSVLIDVRDSYIILPKPVSDKTFVLSRMLHILIHICKTALPLAVPGGIFFSYNYGTAVLAVFFLMVIMAVLFTIFLINACYILILKITTPQKFQNIISYIQIAFAIFFYACYQIVPRVAKNLTNFDISHYKPIVIFPSYWFAGAMQLVYSPVAGIRLWLCLLLSIAVPLFSLWVVIKFFAPSFNQKLALISAGTSEKAVTQPGKAEGISSPFSLFMAKLFTQKGAERSGFLFTWKMMLRSRDFKMKVYPAMGYMVVIIVLMFFNFKISLADIASQSSTGRIATLLIIYFSNLMLISALGQVTVYDKYKAAWIFFIAPLEVPGTVVSGAVKATIAQFFFPIAVVIVIILTSLAGIKILPNILFGMCNSVLISGITAYLTANKLPFSSPSDIKGGRGMLRVSTSMIIGSLLAYTQYILYYITPVIIILSFISGGAAWLLFNAIKKYSWQKITSNYED